jgi:hypothetical protein
MLVEAEAAAVLFLGVCVVMAKYPANAKAGDLKPAGVVLEDWNQRES